FCRVSARAGALFFAAAFRPLAASFCGAALGGAALEGAALGAAVLEGAAFSGAALATPLPLLRPHLPKVRTGAAANMLWHSSKLRLFGSLSFGILALRFLSVMYGP